jgi:hypothetical protein
MMRFQQTKGVKALAALVMFAIAQISMQVGFAEPNASGALPAPQQYIARLRTRGNNPITVNNNAASTGASLVTGAMIETGADQAATIDIGDFTLDIAPNTRLRLDYDDQGRIKVFLISGCAVAKSRGKTQVEVETADNVKQGGTEQKKGGAVDVCFINGQATVNQNAAANAGAGAGSATAAGGGGLSTGAIAGLVLAGVGGAVIAVVAASGGDDNVQSNPSPSSP